MVELNVLTQELYFLTFEYPVAKLTKVIFIKFPSTPRQTTGIGIHPVPVVYSLFINNRSDMLTIEGLGDITFNQSVDDLNFFNNLAVLHNLKTGPFDYKIVLVMIEKVLCAYFGNEFGVGIFFGVLGIEAVFILDKQNSSRTD